MRTSLRFPVYIAIYCLLIKMFSGSDGHWSSWLPPQVDIVPLKSSETPGARVLRVRGAARLHGARFACLAANGLGTIQAIVELHIRGT